MILYKTIVKPIIDILASLILILTSSPIFIGILAILIVMNRGNPFFTQKRIGKNLKLFKVYKFKTMNDNKDSFGSLLPDKDRLTRVGKFIRNTSMDEIPQLINVLKGDMSLIGPRPLLPEYVPYYNENQIGRHNVKPGITGLAQVNGRNDISWEKRFEYDINYVNTISMRLDLKILWKTIYKVLKSDGISAQGYATMPMFSEYMESKKYK